MNRLRFVLIAILAATPLLGAQSARPPQAPPQPAAQEPVATFRSSVRAIQVDAVVTDQDGNPVRGLTEDDFEIVEKGKPQPITTFEAVDIPIDPPQLPDLADSDVVANDGEGRVYLIVIDSISAPNAAYAKRELRKFFDEHFGPSDSAAIMFLDRAHATSGQDFTSNRRLLIKGLDSAVGYGEWDTGGEKVNPDSASPLENNATGPSVLMARNRMERLKDLTEFLIKIPGRRKAMLLVSEAIGFDATDFKDYRGTSMTPSAQAAHAALTAATRGNIAIYPIHPGGASTEMAISGPEAAQQSAAQSQRLAVQAGTLELRNIAAATGGFAHVNSNNFGDAFTRLVQEQSVYYMLAFNSALDKDDGLYVPVTVRVKRPGLKVLAREGYVAPFKGRDNVTAPDRRPGVERALASPVPVGGVPIRAFATPFKGKGKKAAIAVSLEMDPQALGLREEANGSLRGSIDVRLVATDVRANVLPQVRQVGTISIPPESRDMVEREGLHVLTKTELDPGRYQLRIAVGTAQRGGSVIYDLDVPDFSKRELMMSGLVLRGPERPEGVFLPTGDPLEVMALQGPTTSRVFRAGDSVALFAEIYASTSGRPHTVEVAASVRSESGAVTPVAAATRSSEELKKQGDILRFSAPLPLSDLPAGRYVLSVQAKSSAGGDPVAREVPFRIR